MAEITDSVGFGGANKKHDVAMVQLMLRVARNLKLQSYYGGDYDGIPNDATTNALKAFQADQKLVTPKTGTTGTTGTFYPASTKGDSPQGWVAWFALAQPAFTPLVAGTTETEGSVAKGSKTLAALSAALPKELKEIRIIPDTLTIYVAGSKENAKRSRHEIDTDSEFRPDFKRRLGQLVGDMYDSYGIVLWVTPTGRRRTFKQQAAETKTYAGPGESNHNFGFASDIGFRGFQWVRGDGHIVTDADWLNALEKVSKVRANKLWDVRDAAAAKLPLYPLNFERVHLQDFDQKTISNPRSLVALLNTVGKTKWSVGKAAKETNHYKSDLGLGGAGVEVGSAKQIWSGEATITAAQIAQAKSATDPQKKQWKETEIPTTDVQQMKKTLKADFDAADTNWEKWTK